MELSVSHSTFCLEMYLLLLFKDGAATRSGANCP